MTERKNMIKTILWDIDGTILNFLAAEKEAIKSCFKILEMGNCTDDMIEVYSKINVKYWEALERGEMTKPEILVGRFREFFECYGLDTSKAEAFNAEYQVRLGDTICFNKNALETVKSLKGRVEQYIVTNGTKVAQTRKLKNSGLDELVDGVFISEDLGIEKPGKGFFDIVFDTIGKRRRDEAIIIGDSLTSDIKGGNNAGILTCWYNPGHKPVTGGVSVDYEIDDIGDLIKILEKEGF